MTNAIKQVQKKVYKRRAVLKKLYDNISLVHVIEPGDSIT